MRAPPCFCNYVIKGTYLYNTYCGAQLAYPLGGSAVLTVTLVLSLQEACGPGGAPAQARDGGAAKEWYEVDNMGWYELVLVLN